MDEKWVLAWRPEGAGRGPITAARSWTGLVELVAEARVKGQELRVEELRLAGDSRLEAVGPLPAVFDWMIRAHALGEMLPLPVDEATSEL